MIKLSDKTYDVLKYICTILLPSAITLWLTLSSIWHFGLGEPIGATMGAVNVFIGALIGLSSSNYYGDSNEVKHTDD